MSVGDVYVHAALPVTVCTIIPPSPTLFASNVSLAVLRFLFCFGEPTKQNNQYVWLIADYVSSIICMPVFASKIPEITS